MRAAEEPGVEQWLDAQPPESIWTTTITIFEVRFGLNLLARGRRRERLDRAFSRAIADALGGRVLPFDEPAADAAAEFAAERRRTGNPVEIRDVQIAGIVTARRAALATRNRRHFEGFSIPLIDPWKS